MSDFPITSRLREIASDLRAKARESGHTANLVARVLMKEMENEAEKLNAIILEMEQGSAGTTAYQMIAATELAAVETTDTLMQMTAATVLSALIDEEGGGRTNISYSPHAMDEMMRRYEFDAKRDGMITTVSIKPRPGMFVKHGDDSLAFTDTLDHPPAVSMFAQDGIDDTPAEPQVEASPTERPLWALRIGDFLDPVSSQEEAERRVRTSEFAADLVVQIENRFCYHDDCPTTHCNRAPKQDIAEEVTSDS